MMTILRGMKLLLLEGKLLCEPSSAIGIGAALCGQLPVREGQTRSALSSAAAASRSSSCTGSRTSAL